MKEPNYLDDYCSDQIEELYSKFQDSVMQSVVKRIVKYGTVTPSTMDQIDILQESGYVYDDIIESISKLSSLSESIVIDMFKDAAVKNITFDNEIYHKAGKAGNPVNGSPAVKQILNAAIKKTNGNLNNLTLTTADKAQQKFIEACSIAEMDISTGAFDVNTAIRNAIEYAIQDGANVQYYDDDGNLTVTRNIVSAVRSCVLTGLSQTTGEISLQNALDMGTDIMELSAHLGARPTHSLWQGKLVCISNRKTKYLTLADIGYGEVDGFKGISCRHYWWPFVEGVSERTYTDEQLKKMAARTVTYNGKEMLISEANSRQRAMERKIRYERGQLVALNESIQLAKEIGNIELANDLQITFDNISVKLKSHEATYKDFCRQTGQPELSERLQYPGFNRSVSQKAVQGAKRVYMSTQTPTQANLYKTKPVIHTTEELSVLEKYANDKGVKIHQIKSFTGDSKLFKEQIDVVSDISKEFGYDKPVTVMFKDMPTYDYAETSKRGNITINNRMLREKKLTELSLNEDDTLSAKDIRGISAHEMGHVLQQRYGNISLEIVQKAYYNVYGKKIKPEDLYTEISDYSISIENDGIYQELIPEIISKNLTNPNDFTAEFIKLLKERWSS